MEIYSSLISNKLAITLSHTDRRSVCASVLIVLVCFVPLGGLQAVKAGSKRSLCHYFLLDKEIKGADGLWL